MRDKDQEESTKALTSTVKWRMCKFNVMRRNPPLHQSITEEESKFITNCLVTAREGTLMHVSPSFPAECASGICRTFRSVYFPVTDVQWKPAGTHTYYDAKICDPMTRHEGMLHPHAICHLSSCWPPYINLSTRWQYTIHYAARPAFDGCVCVPFPAGFLSYGIPFPAQARKFQILHYTANS